MIVVAILIPETPMKIIMNFVKEKYGIIEIAENQL